MPETFHTPLNPDERALVDEADRFAQKVQQRSGVAAIDWSHLRVQALADALIDAGIIQRIDFFRAIRNRCRAMDAEVDRNLAIKKAVDESLGKKVN